MRRGLFHGEFKSHSEDRAIPLAQAAKIVKPGGIVAGWQWMLKPAFDYDNPRHMDLKRGMEYGGGLRNLNKPDARHEEYKRAGLEVLQSYDMGTDAIERGHLGWWKALTTGVDLPSRLTSSHWGRKLTMGTVKILETIGVAEPGTLRTALDARALRLLGGHGGRAGHLHAGLGDDRARPCEQERQRTPKAHRGHCRRRSTSRSRRRSSRWLPSHLSSPALMAYAPRTGRYFTGICVRVLGWLLPRLSLVTNSERETPDRFSSCIPIPLLSCFEPLLL